MKKILSGLCVLFLLASCVTITPFQSSPPDQQQWQLHQQTMRGINQWQLRGKLALRNGNDGGQADMFWRQDDAQTYEIKLLAPFGAGGSVLTASATQVELALSSGEHLFADNIEQLMATMPNWPFPVMGLRYWLLGVAAPQSSANNLQWNEHGELTLLEQDGWRIELENYAPVGACFLPHKIMLYRLDKSDVNLKLIIRQWSLP